MNNSSQSDQVILVKAQDTTVCCRGTDSALGHPAVYLTFSDSDTVRCYYCGSEFKRAQSDTESS